MTEIIFFAFFVSIAIQGIYFIFLFSRLIFYKDPSAEKTKELPVSIVIVAHQELENLKRLVPALLRQDYNQFEIILVDDRSLDGSYEQLGSEYSNSKLKLIKIENTPDGINPKKYGLNKGILSSEKEIILATDADCYPNSNHWIKEMVQPFESGSEIVLGYSPYETRAGILNMLVRFETFYTGIQYLSFALLGYPYMGVGRNLAYKKTLFIENKGFQTHEHITGGDDDLLIKDIAKKGNVSIKITYESQMNSIPKDSYLKWFKQKKRHLSVGKHYNLREKMSLGLFMLSQFVFYFAFITLFFTFKVNDEIIIGLIVRTLLIITIFTLISRNLKDYFKWYYLPLLDLLYVLNYIIVSIATIISKNTKWT